MEPLHFTTRVQSFADFEGMHYLEISKANVRKLGGKFSVRLLCTINGKLKYPCGLQGMGDGSGWIGLSQPRMKALGLAKGVSVSVKITLDKSRYGLPVPKEMRELFRQDEEGMRRFDRLSAGKRRNILHYVGNSKDSDRRLDRALLVIENLKRLREGEETIAGIYGSESRFNRRS